MTKFALPALALLIFGLFYFSITSQPPDAPSDIAGPREEVTQQPAVAVVEKAEPDRVQQLAKTVDSVSAELKRLSESNVAVPPEHGSAPQVTPPAVNANVSRPLVRPARK